MYFSCPSYSLRMWITCFCFGVKLRNKNRIPCFSTDSMKNAAVTYLPRAVFLWPVNIKKVFNKSNISYKFYSNCSFMQPKYAPLLPICAIRTESPSKLGNFSLTSSVCECPPTITSISLLLRATSTSQTGGSS